jgi:hypothetical protein
MKEHETKLPGLNCDLTDLELESLAAHLENVSGSSPELEQGCRDAILP